MKKNEEYIDYDVNKLNDEIKKQQIDLVKLKFKVSTNEEKNHSLIAKQKKELARLKTELTNKKKVNAS